MNREQYDQANGRELQEAINLLLQQFPALAGREVRLRSILAPLVTRVASNARDYELLGLRTADEMAVEWNVSTRRAQAFIADLHSRRGVGRRIGKLWVLSADEAARYRPGLGGRPRRSAIEE